MTKQRTVKVGQDILYEQCRCSAKAPSEVAELGLFGLRRLRAARRGKTKEEIRVLEKNGGEKQRACGRKHPPPSHTCTT